MRLKQLSTSFAAALLISVAIVYIKPADVSAASFNSGQIISDSTFTNKSSMSVNDIQNFLNQKNSVCLKNYQTPEPLGNNNYGSNVSAARAIWKAGQLYNINPQVLLVTLQKEQGFITRTDCPSWRYQTVMGFGCPDGAPCDSQWYGLSKQLFQAARHFRGFYDRSPGWYVPFAPGNNYVQYHPNSSCGGSTVNIKNRATASLYSYTPYQPNSQALAAGYGTGNGCSSYGNRNFHLYFDNWFGINEPQIEIMSELKVTGGTKPNDQLTAKIVVRNASKSNLNLGRLKAIVRDKDGTNYDFPSDIETVLSPGQYHVYQVSRSIPTEEELTIVLMRNANNVWRSPPLEEFGLSYSPEITRKVLNPVVVRNNVVTSPTNVRASGSVSTSLTIKNTSTIFEQNIGRIKLAVRDSNNNNYDFPSSPELTLAPGQTYTYNTSRSFPNTGKHTYTLYSYRASDGWSTSFPESENSSIVRSGSFTVNP